MTHAFKVGNLQRRRCLAEIRDRHGDRKRTCETWKQLDLGPTIFSVSKLRAPRQVTFSWGTGVTDFLFPVHPCNGSVLSCRKVRVVRSVRTRVTNRPVQRLPRPENRPPNSCITRHQSMLCRTHWSRKSFQARCNRCGCKMCAPCKPVDCPRWQRFKNQCRSRTVIDQLAFPPTWVLMASNQSNSESSKNSDTFL